MKNIYLFFLFITFSSILHAQNIHGIWTGTLVNDSAHRTQNFELGLSEYRGKITGYVYTTFIYNDTLYYSIKRVKAERKDGNLNIVDVEMIGNNFPVKPSKGVHQTTVFPLINDSTIDFTKGTWSTNRNLKTGYYAIGGTAQLKELDNEEKSDLLAHLQEANIKIDIGVNQQKKKEEQSLVKNTTVIKPQRENKQNIPENKKSDIVKNSEEQVEKTKTSSGISDVQKTDTTKSTNQDKNESIVFNKNNETKVEKTTPGISDIQKRDTIRSSSLNNKEDIASNKSNETKIKTTVPGISNIQKRDTIRSSATENKQTIALNTNRQPETKKQNETTVARMPEVKTNDVSSNPEKSIATNNKPVSQGTSFQQKQNVTVNTDQKKDQTVNKDPDKQKIVNTASMNIPQGQQKEAIAENKELPAAVSNRKSNDIQDIIYFKNDSLVLSLYDNGIVDGDTVSVFLNGESIISKQMLKTVATKKTIYIPAKADSVKIVLFAENLGSIPPNTGLLTVRDGDDVYQVHFTADLQKNASIILRRRK